MRCSHLKMLATATVTVGAFLLAATDADARWGSWGSSGGSWGSSGGSWGSSGGSWGSSGGSWVHRAAAGVTGAPGVVIVDGAAGAHRAAAGVHPAVVGVHRAAHPADRDTIKSFPRPVLTRHQHLLLQWVVRKQRLPQQIRVACCCRFRYQKMPKFS